jgi:hypothetical protein
MQKWQRILSSGIIFLLLVIAGAMTVWAADFDDAAELSRLGLLLPVWLLTKNLRKVI